MTRRPVRGSARADARPSKGQRLDKCSWRLAKSTLARVLPSTGQLHCVRTRSPEVQLAWERGHAAQSDGQRERSHSRAHRHPYRDAQPGPPSRTPRPFGTHQSACLQTGEFVQHSTLRNATQHKLATNGLAQHIARRLAEVAFSFAMAQLRLPVASDANDRSRSRKVAPSTELCLRIFCRAFEPRSSRAALHRCVVSAFSLRAKVRRSPEPVPRLRDASRTAYVCLIQESAKMLATSCELGLAQVSDQTSVSVGTPTRSELGETSRVVNSCVRSVCTVGDGHLSCALPKRLAAVC